MSSTPCDPVDDGKVFKGISLNSFPAVCFGPLNQSLDHARADAFPLVGILFPLGASRHQAMNDKGLVFYLRRVGETAVGETVGGTSGRIILKA